MGHKILQVLSIISSLTVIRCQSLSQYQLPAVIPIPTDTIEVIIEGTPHPTAELFHIDFFKMVDPNNYNTRNVLMTLVIRYNYNGVGVNHRINGLWSKEEHPGENPFKRGEKFVLRIILKSNLFQIYVNQKHFTDYTYYIDKENGGNLIIGGDVFISRIDFTYPFQSDAYNVPALIKVPTIINEVTILFSVLPNAIRFNFNFNEDSSNAENILMTLEARYSSNDVILNHKSDKWGTHETDESMPFQTGETYELMVAIKEDTYQVFINGNHFRDHTSYAGKENLHYLFIQGDIHLAGVYLAVPVEYYYHNWTCVLTSNGQSCDNVIQNPMLPVG